MVLVLVPLLLPLLLLLLPLGESAAAASYPGVRAGRSSSSWRRVCLCDCGVGEVSEGDDNDVKWQQRGIIDRRLTPCLQS